MGIGEGKETNAELRGEQTLEETNTLDLVFPQRALDEPPRIVELGLDGDMSLREFFLVLEPKDLDGARTWEGRFSDPTVSVLREAAWLPHDGVLTSSSS